MWRWRWACNGIDYNTASSASTPSVMSNETSCFEDADSPLLTHSVVLKCIGSTKEQIYQVILHLVKTEDELRANSSSATDERT